MLRSYLTLAVRTLRRNLSYTVVNAVGLTVGLACCALVALFLQYELSFDTHHAHADRTYRILSQYGTETYSSIRFQGDADPDEKRALAARLPETIPEVEQATNYTVLDQTYFVEQGDTRFRSDRIVATNTGPAFADVFTFTRTAGAPLPEALSQPASVVLTASAAEKYFGDANPVGQPLQIASVEATVRAVIADPPPNSILQFGILLQLNTVPNWAAQHYVRLAEGTDPAAVASEVGAVMDAVNPDRRDNPDVQGTRLQALPDVRLAPPALHDDFGHRDPAYLWAFAAIGLLVLVITGINYANLALALYAGRRSEVGVRKAVGGHRSQIAGQFLVEAVVLALLCVPLAAMTCTAVIPAFNALMDTGIAAADLFQPLMLGAMIALALTTGLVAGGYPAFVLARKRTVDLFERALSAGGSGRGWSLRHGLIGLQFVVLIGLGSLSWISYSQLQYMQGASLGYDTEGIVQVNNPGSDSADYQVLRRRLMQSPAVQNVAMGPNPRASRPREPFTVISADGSRRTYESGGRDTSVDVHFFDVMGIEHPVVDQMKKEGPSAPRRSFVNEAMAEIIEGDPVGKTVVFNPEDPDARQFEIVGVVPNLHFSSMRSEVLPQVLKVFVRPPWAYNVMVQFQPGQTMAGMDALRTIWSSEREAPLEATFTSRQIAQLYEQERRFGTLAAVLAGLSILLAALGLASLVAYLTQMRRKEIGVRKALGGSTWSIVALLNREYVQIVAAAFAVAVPLAWWAADWWLGRFAYQVDVSVLTFVLSGMGALAVAVASVSLQALRAARVDPAQVLRSE